MAGKHEQKRGASRAQRTAAESRAQRSGQNVYVITPERAGSGTRAGYESTRRSSRSAGGSGGSWTKWLLPILVVMLAAVGVLGATLVRANRIAALDTIFPNISVNGVDVGGMTVEEAVKALEDGGADPYKGASVKVIFTEEKSIDITAAELGLNSDVRAAAEMAWCYGRDGSSPLQSLRSYRAAERGGVDLAWESGAQIDENALRSILDGAAAEVNTELLSSSAEIGEEGVTLTKGMSASHVDTDALFTQVCRAFREHDYADITAVIVTTESEDGGEKADEELLQTVYDTIFKEPVNAMYDKETGGVTEGVDGVSFDMEEAMRLWTEAAPGDEVFIPFVFTEPEIKDLEGVLFRDCLAEKSTSLSGSSSARINNITLAAKAMNDTVLNPGETFDYNTCLGQRTAARGYQEAGAYSGGKHVSEIGGGICQGSSTLYYCAMHANLNITVRYCHYFVVSYLPWGMDATVSWGGPDFRFVNSRDYPIKIKAWVSDGQLTVQIWGTNLDGSYVRITNETWEDSEYYYAQTYRTVYAADGTQLSRQKEAYSSYAKYEAGEETPAPVAPSTPTPPPTEAPTDTPEPTPTPTAPPSSNTPTPPPTAAPTAAPTAVPTAEPTAPPTAAPTAPPTAAPTAPPTEAPTAPPPPEDESSTDA